MARTYNKNKSESAKSTPAKTVPAPAEKPAVHTLKKAAAPVKQENQAKQETPAKSVIAAPDKKVMQQIVYEPSSQILTREVGPNESFGIGDDMPIYYL